MQKTSNDGYSVPKSSKSNAERSQNARKAESGAYAQSFEDDYSQDNFTSNNASKPVSKTGKPPIKSEQKQGRNVISGGKNLANPPSMTQLSGVKTDGTHANQKAQRNIDSKGGSNAKQGK